MRKCRLRLPAILVRLAQREIEVPAVFRRNAFAGQCGLHRRHIRVRERHRLEIGEAPPHFAQPRLDRQRAAIGGHALPQPPDRLEQMAIAHPHFGLIRRVLEHLRIKRQRLVKFADAAEGGGLQIEIAGIVRIFHRHPRQFLQRFARAVGAVEHEREIGARRGEIRGQLDRAAQQVFRVGIAPDAPGKFRKQADRAHVERVFLEQAAQQRLRLVQQIVVHRQRGADEAGIVRGDACHEAPQQTR